jgi:hypothetical protein
VDGILGDYWAYQSRGLGDVIRCLRGRHRPAMSGHIPSGSLVDRCTCGATRYCEGPWFHDGHPYRLVGRQKSARLIAQDRERLRAWEASLKAQGL